MIRGITILAALLVLTACSQEPTPSSPPPEEADLWIERYSYQAGGLLKIQGVDNRSSESLRAIFKARCAGLPLTPWQTTFASQEVDVSPSGGLGYWLYLQDGPAPETVGGPVVCSFSATANGQLLRVRAGPSTIWLETPEPEPRPPKGIPVSPREGGM